ncbi:putative protein N(5)-glutamine methyltransferase [Paenarthrobacter sp. NCHU4564]|uniref:putative protein N(5)-glutamine methyltransferase n=1 Tax=Paenarthrobacter sp. NCHU4564 TaxID=3451353 RepID=UPI003F9C677B
MTGSSAIVERLRTAGCVFAEDEARLLLEAANGRDHLEHLVEQRVQGFPLEHILGWVDFCGSRMIIRPGVFVPRRRTEYLVRKAAHLVAALGKPEAVVVDLCCGSGAIGAAVSDLVGGCELYAADIDPNAVACARLNVQPRSGHVFEGDLYDALPPRLRGRVEALVVNAPYVPTDMIALMPPEARLHESAAALDGGTDGLEVQRRVAGEAAEWLAPGGALVLETSSRQAAGTARVMVAAGLAAEVFVEDEEGATVVVASIP